jgi:hypothetical protein
MASPRQEIASDYYDRTPLSPSFTPNHYSVLCGRGKNCFGSIGNRRFRVTVSMFLERYTAANSKLVRSIMVSDIIDTIRSAGGGFVKFDGGRWWEMSDAVAREKVGAYIRDCLHTKYTSAAKSKMARRRARQRMQKEEQRRGIEEGKHDSCSDSQRRNQHQSSSSHCGHDTKDNRDAHDDSDNKADLTDICPYGGVVGV